MSQFDALEFTEVEVPSILAAQVHGESGPDPAAIGSAMEVTFGRLGAFVQQHAFIPSGPPRAIYTSYGPEGIKFIVAMPITAPPAAAAEDSSGFVESIAGTRAMRFTHRGPYTDLMKTYGLITEFLKARGLMQSEADWAKYMPMWEEYLNDPQTTAPAELLTYIYLPVT